MGPGPRWAANPPPGFQSALLCFCGQALSLIAGGANLNQHGITVMRTMQRSSFVTVFFLASVLAGCSPVYQVAYDYDESLDTARLSTYQWLPPADEAGLNSLDAGRIKNAVNAELKLKGLRAVSEDPDFHVTADIVTKEKRVIRDWGGPFYYPYRWSYYGPRTIDYYQYQEGTFILDFIDPATNKLLWRGTAKAELDDADTPEKRDALIPEVVRKILANFPPY